MRFRPARVSEPESEAMNVWKMVEASLYPRVSCNVTTQMMECVRNTAPFENSLVVCGEVSRVGCFLDRSKDALQAV